MPKAKEKNMKIENYHFPSSRSLIKYCKHKIEGKCMNRIIQIVNKEYYEQTQNKETKITYEKEEELFKSIKGKRYTFKINKFFKQFLLHHNILEYFCLCALIQNIVSDKFLENKKILFVEFSISH